MRYVALYGLLAGCFLSQLNVATAKQLEVTQIQHTERQEARRFWDAVITAKGGRERLHRVENALVRDFLPEKDDKVYGKIGEIHLFAFPNRYWKWSYAGPYPLPSMDVYTGDHFYGITSSGTEVDPGGDPQGWMEEESIVWLLETRWFRPEPVRVTRQRVGKQQVDVIETNLDGKRFDFTVDIESLMILKVSRYGKVSQQRTRPWREDVFKDYVAVDGIQMPAKDALLDDGKLGPWYTSQFSFNVKYNPHLFDVPPHLTLSPDAWKPKSQ